MTTPVRCRLAVLKNVVVISGTAAALGVAPTMALAAHSSAKTKKKKKTGSAVGSVYTESNTTPNYVLAFKRNSNGTLGTPKRVATHGKGTSSQPPFGLPIVDSSGSVNLTKDGRLLFVVNSGDNSVSSFQVTSSGLKFVTKISSGGTLPISLTSSGSLLYVLNGLSGNIYGLRISSNGRLKPIAGSTRSLFTPGKDGVAAQIGFAPGGGVLAVTERYKDIIDTYKMRSDGTPGPVQANHSTGAAPFGFAYQGRTHVVVSNVGAFNKAMPGFGDPSQFVSSASSYTVPSSGVLAPIDQLPPGKVYTVPTGGRAACWVVVTKDYRFAFVTNTLSSFPPGSGNAAITRYAVAADGTLTNLGPNENTQGPGFAADEALSPDSRYLYVLVQTLMPPMPPATGNGNTSHIDTYSISAGGSLTPVGSTPATLPIGVSGIAAN